MNRKEQNKIKLDSLPKTNVFRVPEGYFLSLVSEIEAKIIETNSVLKTSIHRVPEGYFDKLQEGIISKLPMAKEIPLVGNVHSVPEGYFDSLPYKIQERINQKRRSAETQVIQLIPAVRYSIAAGLIAAILVSSIALRDNFFSRGTGIAKKKQTENPFVATILIASLSKAEIQEYLESEGNIDINQLMKYSSPVKKEKIKKEFEKDLLNIKLEEKEKRDLEMELDDIDLTELYPEI